MPRDENDRPYEVGQGRSPAPDLTGDVLSPHWSRADTDHQPATQGPAGGAGGQPFPGVPGDLPSQGAPGGLPFQGVPYGEPHGTRDGDTQPGTSLLTPADLHASTEPRIADVPHASTEPRIADVPHVFTEPRVADVPHVSTEPRVADVPHVSTEPRIADVPQLSAEPRDAELPHAAAEPRAGDETVADGGAAVAPYAGKEPGYLPLHQSYGPASGETQPVGRGPDETAETGVRRPAGHRRRADGGRAKVLALAAAAVVLAGGGVGWAVIGSGDSCADGRCASANQPSGSPSASQDVTTAEPSDSDKARPTPTTAAPVTRVRPARAPSTRPAPTRTAKPSAKPTAEPAQTIDGGLHDAGGLPIAVEPETGFPSPPPDPMPTSEAPVPPTQAPDPGPWGKKN